MVIEGLRVAGDDGSGLDSDWRRWTASVDGTNEAVTEPVRETRPLGRTGLAGIINMAEVVHEPLRAMADMEARLLLGDLSVGPVSFN